MGDMGVVRFLLIVLLLAWVARILWRWWHVGRSPVAAPGAQTAQALCRCSRCGTLIPGDRALGQKERPYCSIACQEKGEP
ncbi:MAG: hypothetical protein HQL88_10925 [Magnetococcales bacterium]|nr:hypothetical protein [Magnetococcales bacterium]